MYFLSLLIFWYLPESGVPQKVAPHTEVITTPRMEKSHKLKALDLAQNPLQILATEQGPDHIEQCSCLNETQCQPGKCGWNTL